MDKETAEKVYCARMARFVSMQNELALYAIELGIDEGPYLSATKEAFQDMTRSVSEAHQAMKAIQMGSKIGELIKKATDDSN